MKKTPLPFRAYSPSSPDNPDPQSRAQINVLNVYPAAALMARGVPSLLGYHGMESQSFDALLGAKNVWQYQFSREHLGPVRRQVLRDHAGAAAAPRLSQDSRAHELADPVGVHRLRACCSSGIRRPRWVRVVPAAVKLPDDQIPPTIASPGFPVNDYVLFSDTSTVQGAITPTKGMPSPPASPVKASLAAWSPGAMTVKLDAADTETDLAAGGGELVSRLARDH